MNDLLSKEGHSILYPNTNPVVIRTEAYWEIQFILNKWFQMNSLNDGMTE